MNTIIKLAPGNIGWYDPLTAIHLTLAKTESIIKPGMNLTNIKKALAEGKIIIKQGILETSRQLNTEPINNIKTEEKQVVTTSLVDNKKNKVTRTRRTSKTKKSSK